MAELLKWKGKKIEVDQENCDVAFLHVHCRHILGLCNLETIVDHPNKSEHEKC